MIEDTKVVINSEEGQTIQWPKEKAQNNDMPAIGQKTKYL